MIGRQADDILRYGVIVSDREYKSGRDFCREYTIEFDDKTWFLGKKNGAWIFVKCKNLADARL